MGAAVHMARRAKEMDLAAPPAFPWPSPEKAASARRKIAQGLNPIDERKRDGGIPTFGEMADDVRETLPPVSETRSTRLNGNRRWRPTPLRCAPSQ